MQLITPSGPISRGSNQVTVLIIANRVDHEVQRPLIPGIDPVEDRKREFEEMLCRCIAERGIQFTGEEASHKWEMTTARSLAIRWGNIDMPMEERERRGVLEEQIRRPRIPSYLGDRARAVLGWNRNRDYRLTKFVLIHPAKNSFSSAISKSPFCRLLAM